MTLPPLRDLGREEGSGSDFEAFMSIMVFWRPTPPVGSPGGFVFFGTGWGEMGEGEEGEGGRVRDGRLWVEGSL